MQVLGMLVFQSIFMTASNGMGHPVDKANTSKILLLAPRAEPKG